MNNLHGWAMSRYLPYGRFKWLKNADNFDVNLIMKRVDIGYILEANLEYPNAQRLSISSRKTYNSL